MKNNEILLETIGEIDPALVPPLRRRTHPAVWAAAAAALIALAVTLPHMGKTASASPYDRLPQTSLATRYAGETPLDPTLLPGTAGFEGMMAYDIAELQTPTPWDTAAITALPVFRERACITEGSAMGMVLCLSETDMIQLADDTAAALGIAVTKTETTYLRDFVQGGYTDEQLASVYSVEATCEDGTQIAVYGDGKICITFDGLALPDKYHFTYDTTTPAEADAVLAYLTDRYASLLGYGHAAWYSFADRTFDGVESRHYYAYDQSSDPVEALLAKELTCTQFAPDDAGRLLCIWLQDPYCTADYLGDYPIVTAAEAEARLLEGAYQSSVPEGYLKGGTVSAEDIAWQTLVYREANGTLMPFYQFYVTLDTSAFVMPERLQNFGIFYVPAVQEDLLT